MSARTVSSVWQGRLFRALLLTMGLATRGTGFCKDDVVTSEWELARELGIPITVHVAMGRLAGRFAMVTGRIPAIACHAEILPCEWARRRDPRAPDKSRTSRE